MKGCFWRFLKLITQSIIRSVDSESLAEVPRLLDELDHVDLLFEENSEEVGIISATAKKLTEGAFVLLAGHERR